MNRFIKIKVPFERCDVNLRWIIFTYGYILGWLGYLWIFKYLQIARNLRKGDAPRNKCPYFYPVCLMTEYPLPRECHVNNLNWFSRHKPLSGKNLVVNKVDFGSGLIQRIQCFEYKQSSLILKLYKIAFLRKTVLILAPVSNDHLDL